MARVTQLTEQIRAYALQLGFNACGFAKATALPNEARRLEEWLKQERNAGMQWMGNYFDKRTDPTLLVPGAKTIVSVISSYHHPIHNTQKGIRNKPLVAKYAQGRDYHKVVKKKLQHLFDFTAELIGDIEGRVFVDSAPVMDKVWAQRAGLGWIGKNSNLLNKDIGSFFFIGEMIISAELSYDTPVTDHCGQCTRCIDACPTNAIYEPYRVDASKCISYLTIEHKGDIDPKLHENMQNWIFGCDICQDVCPWNSKALTAVFEDLYPRASILEKDLDDWLRLDDATFETAFTGSPLKRTKFSGLSRNLRIAAANIKKLPSV